MSLSSTWPRALVYPQHLCSGSFCDQRLTYVHPDTLVEFRIPKLNVLAMGSEYMVLGEMFLLDVEGRKCLACPW